MFEELSQEDNIAKHEKILEEVMHNDAKLAEEMEAFFSNLGITPEDLDNFLSNPANFSSEEWTLLQELKSQTEASLQSHLDNIPDPGATQKKYEDMHVARHWLYVR